MLVGLAKTLSRNCLSNYGDVHYRSFVTTSLKSLQNILDIIFQEAFLLLVKLAIFQGENEV